MNYVDALLFHSIITIILGADILALGFSLVPQMVKNPLAMQETRVWSLGWEDPLEKGMATHHSVLTES